MRVTVALNDIVADCDAAVGRAGWLGVDEHGGDVLQSVGDRDLVVTNRGAVDGGGLTCNGASGLVGDPTAPDVYGVLGEDRGAVVVA